MGGASLLWGLCGLTFQAVCAEMPVAPAYMPAPICTLGPSALMSPQNIPPAPL